MSAAENRSVVETDALRPRLRDGLRFSVQESGGERVCVIEDAHASRFHRVGLGELRFFRALDGTRTVASILAQLAQRRHLQMIRQDAEQKRRNSRIERPGRKLQLGHIHAI